MMATVPDRPRDDVALRTRILAEARTLRAPGAGSPTFVDPYAAAVQALDRRIRRLSTDQWRVRVIYDWSVHDMIAHLAATDAYVHNQLTAGSQVSDNVSQRTAEAIARERRRAPEQTRATWRSGADALLAAAHAARRGGWEAESGDPPVPDIRFGGARLSVQRALLQRAFETWIHSEDVCAALGEPPPLPPPTHVWQLANQAVELLPHLFAASGLPAAGRSVRIVLTGGGGGEWLIALEPGARASLPDTEMIVDVLDFCRRVGDRRHVEDIAVRILGDERLVHELLQAASAFAGP